MCTAIQIALVDLLSSWGIRPSAVTGHSSGEIGCGYAAGALTMEDAMTLAYHRGAFSPEMATKKGAMMAISMSEEEATGYLNLLKSGKAVVACVNSPTSMTISGDETAIDELKSILDEKGLFTRKLVVEVAYHSHHMEPAAKYHRGLISSIIAKDNDNGVDFFSSVTGSKLPGSALGPDYWVSNMLGQVKFAHSLRALTLENRISPEKKGKTNNTNGEISKPAVDFLVEIGPHSALGGPIQQILKADKILDKALIGYGSALVRKISGAQSILDLASALLHSGYEVDMKAINFPTGVQQDLPTIVDLPTYPWNHSNSYWGESRLSKAYRQRKHPRRDLIGAPDHNASPSEPRWRGHIRTEEIPWVKDHKIQSNIVYPAAGYLSMAIEAAWQLCQEEHDTKVIGFTLREINIQSALVLTEQTESEVFISFRSPRYVVASLSQTWWSFYISSVTEDNKWTQHCHGLITVHQDPNPVDDVTGNRESENERKKLRSLVVDVESRGNNMEDVGDFYNHLTSLGLEYGKTFANMTKACTSGNTCVAEITIPDTAATMPMNYEYPFVIHPSTLDSMLHPVFVALSSGTQMIQDPAVPISIDEVYVSNDIASTPGDKLKVCATANKIDDNNLVASILAMDAEQDGNTNLSIVGLKCKVLPRDTNEANQDKENRMAYNIEWLPDPDLLVGSAAVDFLSNKDPFNTVAQYIRVLSHKNPQLSILELGAGAGVATLTVLRALGGENGNPANFRQYIYTDNMNESSKQAAKRLTGWGSLIKFKTLDIEGDVVSQGFETNSHDVVVIAHGISQKSLALKNIHSILKEGGRIVVIGNAEQQEWDSQLRENGFSGADLVIKTNAGPDNTIIVSQVAKKRTVAVKEVLVIAEEEESGVSVAKLTGLLQNADIKVNVTTFSQAQPDAKTCIVLSDMTSPILEKPDSKTWEILKSTFIKSEGVLWVTRGALIASSNPNANLVTGFARTARSENGESTIVTLDLDCQIIQSGDAAAETIFSIFSERLTNGPSSPGKDVEYAERDGLLLIPRVKEASVTNMEIDSLLAGPVPTEQYLSQPGRPLRASGKPDYIHFVDIQQSEPLSDDHILIEVKAASLTKTDLLASSGTEVPGFGSGVSGVVRAVGKAVTNFTTGDRVAGLGKRTAASFYSDTASMFQRIPDAMHFDVAAALPATYISAYHLAHNLAHIAPGNTVLIHEAALPIGHAIAEFCKLLGATIFATVGTVDQKNKVINELGIPDSHILFNRNASFVKGIGRMTNDTGVDVVFNSVHGDEELSRQSWNCIASFGCFIELDHQAITSNSCLEMRNFSKDASFIAFNLQNLLQRKRGVVNDVWSKVIRFFQTGVLGGPTTVRTFPMSQIAEALTHVETREQTGLVVVDTQPGMKVNVRTLLRW
jgi:acyl transferase domain-containing protein/NADPH:quinone reductase-like Zn-dependent oxidoreductase